MPLFRLAKPNDYIPFKHGDKTLYQIKWDSNLSPGNPTEDPNIGVNEYNLAKINHAKGGEDLSSVFLEALNWCLESESIESKSICRALRNTFDTGKSLQINEKLSYPALQYYVVLSLMPDKLKTISAATMLQIRVKARE